MGPITATKGCRFMSLLWFMLFCLQSNGEPLTQTTFVQARSGLRLTPEKQAVLLDPNGPPVVFNLSYDGAFQADMTFEAAVIGPGLDTPYPVSVPAAEGRISLTREPFSEEGVYHLINTRLVRAGQVIAFAEPDRAEIQVAENFVLSEVQVTPLSRQDLVDRGYLFSDEDYYTVEFELALMIGSKEENVSVPVAFPKKETESFQPVILEDPFKPYLRMLTFPVSGERQGLPPGALPDPPSAQQYIPGLILIPGNFNYLRSHFDVTALVLNAAPEGFDVRVSQLQARLRLPDPTRYGLPLTLRDEALKDMVFPGEDGILGTGDDRDFILPGEKAEAGYVVIGNIPGMYDVEVEVTGEVQLPQETQPVNTVTRGQIFVRSPEFNVNFEHPDAVAENEVYTLVMNIVNRGEVPLEGFSVTLDPDTLVGCELYNTHPVQQAPDIPVGGTGQIRYDLRAGLSGTVISSYFKIEGAVQGALQLRVGVGEIGQRISPYVVHFPEIFHTEFPLYLTDSLRQFAKTGLDIAQMTESELPQGLVPVTPSAVREFNSLALFTARAGTMGFSDGEQLARLFSLWVRSVNDYAPLDAVRRRQINVGTSNPEPAFARAFAETAGLDDTSLLRLLAQENETLSNLFVLMVDSDEAVDVLLDGRNQTAAGSRTTPFSTRLALSPTRTLFWLQAGETVPRFSVQRRDVGQVNAAITALFPSTDGGRQLARQSAIAFDTQLEISFDLAENTLRLAPRDGLSERISGTLIPPKPFVLKDVRQVDPTVLPGADIFGRDLLFSFSKPLDLNSLDSIEEHILINGKSAVDAKLQPDGLSLIVSARMPLGPYHPITYELREPAAKSGEQLSTLSGTIQGSPWFIGCSVLGRIVDRNGTDLANAKIFHWKPDPNEEYKWRIFETATLDAEGRYQFAFSPFPVFSDTANEKLRTLKIGVLLEDGRYEEREFYPAGAGQQLVADFSFLQQGSLRGTVRDADGNPVAGATIYAVNQSNELSAVLTETDEFGRYRADGLEVGQVLVKSSHQKIIGYASGYLTQNNSPLTVDITIANPSSALSGTISVLENGEARPLEGAIVAFILQNGLTGSIRIGSKSYPYTVITTTDADGGYSLPENPVGNGFWWVYAPQYGYFERLIAVIEGEDQVIDHQYDGNPVPRGTVAGLVRTTAGTPIEGATVVVDGKLGQTNALGRFAIDHVERGLNHQVTARHPDYGRGTFSLFFDSERDETSEIVLRRPITVSGRFVNAAGEPIPFADIFNPPYPMVIEPLTQTDADGYWSATLPQPGTYAITTVDWPHIAAVDNLQVTESGADQVLLQQWETADLRVRLVNSAGQPVVAKVGVRSMLPNDFTLALGLPALKLSHIDQFTDPQGEITIRDLNVGNFEVWGESGLLGETETLRSILEPQADGAEPRTVTLVFPDSLEPANLFGKVFDSDGIAPAPAGTVVQVKGPGLEARVRTDAQGNYRFESLVQTDEPVRISIIAGHPDSGRYDTAWVDLNQDINFRYDLSLRTKGTAEVRVINGDGTPAVNAAVEVTYRDVTFVPPTEPSALGDMKEEPIRETGQIVAGTEFLSFDDIPTGPFTVRVSSGNGLVGLRSYVIPVDGGVVPLTIKLEAASQISGVFLDHDDAEIPAAEIQLLERSRLLQQRLSDDDGRFLFPDLPMRSYRLNGTNPADGLQGNLEVVTSPYQPQAEVVLRLDDVAGLEGTLFHEGEPVPNAQVTIENRGLRVVTGSGADGRYRFRNLPLGDYEIRAESPSLLGKIKTGVTLDQAFVIHQRDLTFGRLLDVALYVAGADGLPVDGLLVTVENLDYKQVVGNSATTTAAGIALLTDLPTGTYRISGSHPAEAVPLSGRFTITEADSEPAERAVQFTGWGAISGVVSDTTGQPLAEPVHVNFEYRINGKRTAQTISTDSAGAFRLDRLPVGSQIDVTAVNVATQKAATREIELTQHREEAEVNLTFRTATYVAGRVSFADGSAAVGADVWVNEPYRILVQTDDMGEFLLQPVLEGETTLYAKARDSERKAAVTLDIAVVNGAPVPVENLDVSLGGVANISGLVTYSDGTPLRTGNVTLEVTDLDLTLNTLIQGDGRYHFTQVPLGDYSLRALDRRFDKLSEPVLTSADSDGATVTQDLIFQPSYELTGRLMGTNGAQPVDGGLVELWRPDPDRPEDLTLIYAAYSDRDGYFRIEHVYPGPYQLVAEDPALTGNYSAPFTMPNEDLDLPAISLRTRAWMLGSLTDGDGDPFILGTVTLTQNGRATTKRLNPDGTFDFEELEVGSYALSYNLNGGWIQGQTSGLLTPGANSVPIIEVATHSLTGRAILIRTPAAKPSVQVTVNNKTRAATLNAAGDFVFDGVPADQALNLRLQYAGHQRNLTLDPLSADRELGDLYLDTTPPSIAFADNGATVTSTPYRMVFNLTENDPDSAVDVQAGQVSVNGVDISDGFTNDGVSLVADFDPFPAGFVLGNNQIQVTVANQHGAQATAEFQLTLDLNGLGLVVQLRRGGNPVIGQVRLDDGTWRTTDDNGRLSYNGIVPGRHSLKARDGEFGGRAGLNLVDAVNQTETIDLTPFGNYRGRVLDLDGNPVADATLQIGAHQEHTNSDGTFLFDYLNLSDHILVVSHASTGTALQPAALSQNGETLDLGDLNLEALGAVAGIVFDDDGVTPIGGASLRLQVAGLPAQLEQTTVSGSDGRFQFDNVLARDFTVSATSADGQRSDAAGGTVSGQNQTAQVTLILSPAADLIGRLLDRDGAVVGATEVAAVSAGLRVTTVSDDAGRFSFNGLPYGEYQLQVEARDLLQYLNTPQTVDSDSIDVGDLTLITDQVPTINAFAFPDRYDLATRPQILLNAADDRALARYVLSFSGAYVGSVGGNLNGTDVERAISPAIPGTATEGVITWRLTVLDQWRQTAILEGQSTLVYDSGGPSLTLNEPQAGATFLEGDTITVAADATDPAGINRIEATLNGNAVGSDNTRPYTIDFLAPGVVDPEVQTLSVTAVSARGLSTTVTRDLLISPRSSAGGPQVSLRAPENGIPLPFNLQGGLLLAVNAAAEDADGLESVLVEINGNAVHNAAVSGTNAVIDERLPLPAEFSDAADVLVEVTFTDLGGNPTKVITRVINAPLADDAEVFSAANPLTLESWDVRLRDKTVVLAGGAHIIDGAHQFAALVLVNDAQLSQTATSSDSSLPAWTDLTLTAGLVIDFGAAIDLNGKGYRGMPPGVGSGSVHSAHGGLPYGGTDTSYIYGSVFEPSKPGSRRGGGAVKISADSLWLAGDIHANSQLTGSYLGSGGSIWLTGTTFAGRGQVTANGFFDAYLGSTSLGGGGGRIAIYGPFSGEAQAFGGINAGAGTVYLRHNDSDRLVVANHPEAVRFNLTWLPTLTDVVVGSEVYVTDEISPQGIPRQVLSFIDPPVLTPDVFIGQRAFNSAAPDSSARIANQTDTRLFSQGETRFGDFADGDLLSVAFAVDHIEVRDNAHFRLDHDPGAVFSVTNAHLDFGTRSMAFGDGRLLFGDRGQVTGHLTLADALTITDAASPRFNGSLRLPELTINTGRFEINGSLDADRLVVAAEAVLATPNETDDAVMYLTAPVMEIDGRLESTHTRNSANYRDNANRYHASHGGFGGGGGFVEYDTQTTLGSLYQPETIGAVYNNNFGSGGAIRLDFDSLNLNGAINTNGQPNSRGAGGSILLQGQTLSGDGDLAADGSQGYYTGGGGRIAIRVNDITAYRGAVSAVGGNYSTSNIKFKAGAGTIFYQTDTWPNGRLVLDNQGTISRPGSTYLPSLGRHVLSEAGGGATLNLDGLPAFNALAGLHLLLEDGRTARIGGNDETTLQAASGQNFPNLTAGDAVHGLHVLDVLEVHGNANLKTDDHLRVLQQLIADDGAIDAASISLPAGFSYRDGSLELFQDPGLTDLELDNFRLTVHFPLNLNSLTLTNGAELYSTTDVVATTTRVLDGTLIINGALRGDSLEVAETGTLRTPNAVVDAGLLIEVAQIDIAGNILAHSNPNSGNADNRYRGSHGGYGGQGSQVDLNVQQTYGTLYYPQTNGSARTTIDQPGGRLHLRFTNLNLSGSINVDGNAINSPGGSILLEGQRIAGSGALSANGFGGYSSAGGGRIALLVEDLQNYDGAVTAFGGVYGSNNDNFQGGAGTVFYRNSQWPNGRLVVDNNGTTARAGSTTLPGLGQRTADSATGGDSISGFGYPAFNSLHGLYLIFPDGSEQRLERHSQNELFPAEGATFPSLAVGDTYSAVHIFDVLEIQGNAQLRSIDGIRVLEEFIIGEGGIDTPDLDVPTDTVLRDGSLELFENPGYTSLALDNFQLRVHFPLNLESLRLENGASLTSEHLIESSSTDIIDGTLTLDGTLRGDRLLVAANGMVQTPENRADAGYFLDVTEIEVAGALRAHANPNSANGDNLYHATHGGYGGSAGSIDYDVQRTYGSLYQPENGGGGSYRSGQPGGHIRARFSTMTLSGLIDVDGIGTRSAGGSVLLEGQSFSGTGPISANGYTNSYTGGGGRIALLVEDQAGYSGLVTAYGGRQNTSRLDFQAGAGTVFYRDATRWPNGKLVIDNNGTTTHPGSTTLPGLGERTLSEDSDGSALAGDFPAFHDLIGLHLLFPDQSLHRIAYHDSTRLLPAEGSTFPALAAGETYRGVHLLDELIIRGEGQLRTVDGLRVLNRLEVAGGGIDSPALEAPADFIYTDGALALYQDPGLSELTLDNFHLTVHFPLNLTNLTLRNGATLTATRDMDVAVTVIEDGSLILNGRLHGDSLNLAATGRIQTQINLRDAGLVLDVTDMTLAGDIIGQSTSNSNNTDNRFFASHGGYGGVGGQVNYDNVATYGSLYRPQTIGSAQYNGTGPGARVHLIFDQLDFSGTINVDGSAARSAGGSILLEGNRLVGAGNLSANGRSEYYTGGGGRIAVLVADQSGYSGGATAFGGGYNTSNLGFQAGAGTVFYRDADRWPNGRLVVDNNGTLSRPGSTTLPGLGQRTAANAGDGTSITTTTLPEFNGLTGLHLRFADETTVPVGSHDANTLLPASGQSFPAVAVDESFSGIHIFDVLEIRGNANLKTIDGIRVLSELVQGEGTIDTPDLDIPGNGGMSNGSIELVEDPGYDFYELDNFQLTVHFPIDVERLQLRNGSSLTTANGTIIAGSIDVDALSSLNTRLNTPGISLRIVADDITVAGTIRAVGNAMTDNPDGMHNGSHGGQGGSYRNRNLAPSYGSFYEPRDAGTGTIPGGFIEMEFNTLQLDGSIDADALAGNGYSSGGAIMLRGNVLRGAGLLTAKGGANFRDASGGGRIAVHVPDTGAFTGTAEAYGGHPGINVDQYRAGAGTIFFRTDVWPNGRLIIDNGGVNSLPASTTILGVGEQVQYEPTGEPLFYGGDLPRRGGLRGSQLVFPDGQTRVITENTATTLTVANDDQSLPAVTEGDVLTGLHVLDVLEVRGGANLRSIDPIRIEQNLILDNGLIDTPSLTLPTNYQFANGSGELTVDPGLPNLTLDQYDLKLSVPIGLDNLTLRNGANLEINQPIAVAQHIEIGAESSIFSRMTTDDLNPDNRYRSSHGGHGGGFSPAASVLGSPYLPQTSGRGNSTARTAGGTIELTFATMTVDGSVEVDGTTNGAGGSILLRGQSINGAGRISANGGTEFRGAGGGGRIALLVEDLSQMGASVTAYGGRAGIGPASYNAGAGTILYRNQSQWPNGRLVIDNNGTVTRPGSTELVSMGTIQVAEDSLGARIRTELLPPYNALTQMWLRFPDGSSHRIGSNSEDTLYPETGASFPPVQAGETLTAFHRFDVLEVRGEGQLTTIDGLEIVQDFRFEGGSLAAGDLQLPADAGLRNGSLDLYSDPGLSDLSVENFQLNLHLPLTLDSLSLGADTTVRSGHTLNATRIDIAATATLQGLRSELVSSDETGYRNSHGGLGGAVDTSDYGTHGSFYRPRNSGRGDYPSMIGGGQIHLVFDELQLDGTLNVSGSGRTAGGSILLEGNRLLGGGSLQADGAAEFRNSGGGGRIAIHVNDLSAFSGTWSARGGRAGIGPAQYNAGAGTVFLRTPNEWPNGRLIVDNGDTETVPGSTRLPGLGSFILEQANSADEIRGSGFPALGGLTGMHLVFESGETVAIGAHSSDTITPLSGSFPIQSEGSEVFGLHRLDVLEIHGLAQLVTDDAVEVLQGVVWNGGALQTGTLQLPAGTVLNAGSLQLHTDPGLRDWVLDDFQLDTTFAADLDSLQLRNGAGLDLRQPLAAGTIDLASGTRITARDQGEAANPDNRYHSSHGGYGAVVDYDTVSTLGNLYQPLTHGRASGANVYGGGAVSLDFQTLTLEGDIDVSGTNHGAGGSIFLRGDVLTGSGNLIANGGSEYRSAGGGGRIGLWVEDVSGHTGQVTAFGGRSGINVANYNAGAGTVFYRNQNQWPNGRLLIDNDGTVSPAGSTRLPSLGSFFLEGADGDRIYGEYPAYRALVGMRLINDLGDETAIIDQDAESIQVADAAALTAVTTYFGLHQFDEVEVYGAANFTTDDGVRVLERLVVADDSNYTVAFEDSPAAEKTDRRFSDRLEFDRGVRHYRGDYQLHPNEALVLREPTRYGTLVVPAGTSLTAHASLEVETLVISGGNVRITPSRIGNQAGLQAGRVQLEAGRLAVASLLCGELRIGRHAFLGPPLATGVLRLDTARLHLAGTLGSSEGQTWLVHPDGADTLAVNGGTMLGITAMHGGILKGADLRAADLTVVGALTLTDCQLQVESIAVDALALQRSRIKPTATQEKLEIHVGGDLVIDRDSAIDLDGLVRKPGYPAHGGLPQGFGVDPNGGRTYDSPFHPTQSGRGTAAGGALVLHARELLLEGRISAAGRDFSSGGALLLHLDQLLGTGRIDVAGGTVGGRHASQVRAAGGGRIAIHLKKALTFAGAIVTGQDAAAGSLVVTQPDQTPLTLNGWGADAPIADAGFTGYPVLTAPPPDASDGDTWLWLTTPLEPTDVAGLWLHHRGHAVRVIQAVRHNGQLGVQLAASLEIGAAPIRFDLPNSGGAR